MILAAANPDISGPIVIEWRSGGGLVRPQGQNPMRYKGGMGGGIAPALFLSDLGGGVFDGAHIVGNFEELNPGRNFFGKYYDLFADVDSDGARERFLEFEKWWAAST